MTVDAGLSGLVDVVKLDDEQWPTLRTMRLRALCDAPAAFVTTLALEAPMPPTYWQDRATSTTWVVARNGNEDVGIACLAPPDADAARSYFVESVWVDPQHRSCGVMTKMLDLLEVHALAAGATELRLWVLDTNESARRAYQKLDFSPVVDREQETAKRWGDGTPVVERLMSKPLLSP